jgi:hypothetical protein
VSVFPPFLCQLRYPPSSMTEGNRTRHSRVIDDVGSSQLSSENPLERLEILIPNAFRSGGNMPRIRTPPLPVKTNDRNRPLRTPSAPRGPARRATVQPGRSAGPRGLKMPLGASRTYSRFAWARMGLPPPLRPARGAIFHLTVICRSWLQIFRIFSFSVRRGR